MSAVKFQRTSKCPECKKRVIWSIDNIYKPFCSKRCQLLDLGSWISERHFIPGSALKDSDLEVDD